MTSLSKVKRSLKVGLLSTFIILSVLIQKAKHKFIAIKKTKTWMLKTQPQLSTNYASHKRLISTSYKQTKYVLNNKTLMQSQHISTLPWLYIYGTAWAMLPIIQSVAKNIPWWKLQFLRNGLTFKSYFLFHFIAFLFKLT